MPRVSMPPRISCFSKTVTANPSMARNQAQARPAGPLPTTATFSSRFCFFFWDRGNSVFPGPVGQKTMQGHDGDGCIHIGPGAGRFAGVVADPAADAGEGVLAAEQFEGLLVFALGHQGDAALETGVGRAGGLAGGRSLFLDGVGRWHGLGVALEGRFAGAQALVEVVGHVDGAHLAAFAAGGTTFHIDEAGPLAQGGGEVARLAGDGLYIGHGVQVDVQVAAGLHQLGGNDAHGAVVGGEGLVQLGHDAADGRTLFSARTTR
jgi:hypothetical protein